ncbi:MAG: hypothetical protein AB8I58_10070 [Anaerolineales bacterium]
MHTMKMVNKQEGAEEWFCPLCGRHLLVSWTPKFKRTVLVEGDSTVPHSGSKGNLLTMNRVDVAPEESLLPECTGEQIEVARLQPWLEWMEERGFESLWSRDNR